MYFREYLLIEVDFFLNGNKKKNCEFLSDLEKSEYILGKTF